MKKLILTILTTITILGVNAQGNNLQFNRALFESVATFIYNITTNDIEIQNSFTVPAGKTWKITAIGGSDRILSNTDVNNASSIWISKSGENKFMNLAATRGTELINPLWLPEGSYDVFARGGNQSPRTYHVLISGIEFNIVQ